MQPSITFVITVFNKEKHLPGMISSVLRQSSNFTCDYIFVDDASTDDSVNVIKTVFNGKTNYQIIENQVNKGPSVRLNQSCFKASGKYLFLMDADDILAVNALEVMVNALEKENADFVFGRHKITDQTQDDLLQKQILTDYSYTATLNPLKTILNGKYVRMAYLVTKNVYLKAQGADERIFIQDESLPLRLGYHSTKMVTLTQPAIYAAKDENSLSKNKLKQINNRFYAYYYALRDFSDIRPELKTALYRRAISSIWKAKKLKSNFFQNTAFFAIYIRVKYLPLTANIKFLDKYRDFMDGLEDVK
jgi:glycosyltransferase involved in cell wall biosynthesis